MPVTRGRRVGGGGSDAGPAAVQCREGGEAGCRMLRAAQLLLLWLPLVGAGDTDEPTQESVPLGEPPPGLALFRWQWHEVEAPYLVALWILVASLAKIGECVCVCSRARAQAGGPQRTRLQTPGSPDPVLRLALCGDLGWNFTNLDSHPVPAPLVGLPPPLLGW